jgi:hypothetical protein
MQTNTLPTIPAELADHIQAVGDTGILPALIAQIGRRPAFQLLATAHSIVANRLWNS